MWNNTFSQNVKRITWQYIVNEAAFSSPAAEIERLNYRNEILEFENYKKKDLPSISFTLNPLNINRSLKLLQHPEDGSYTYVEDFTLNSNAGVLIRQKISGTGGEVTLGSNLNYLSELSTSNQSFSTTPYTIGYSQQLLGGHKKNKLEKDLACKKNVDAVNQFCVEMSGIQQKSMTLYLKVCMAGMQKEAALRNRNMLDTLLNIARIKYANGQSTDYDYKQVELQFENCKYDVIRSNSQFSTALNELKNFLQDESIKESSMVEMPIFNLPVRVEFDEALLYVSLYNPYAYSEEIKRLEAEQSLLNARLKTKLNSNLSINHGVNQYAESFLDSYKKPNTRQSVSVSIQIPICQWGINRNELEIAENTYQSKLLFIEQKQNDFLSQVHNRINAYNQGVVLLNVAENALNLANTQMSLITAKFAYGSSSVYEINSSRKDLDVAMNQYYDAVNDVWSNYFEVRQLVLFDFIEQKPLINLFIN